jgi:chemotaxis protein methyltransferase WspC
MMREFELLLKRTMGLDAATIGSSAVERAVQRRRTACGLGTVREYWDLVQGSRAELQALVETISVPETWFFRDREAFAQLKRVALLPRKPQQPLQVLSLPCSTGEEPYTIAMSLLEAGLAPERFAIDAVDISGALLQQAQRAVYGTNSFRAGDLTFRDRFFHESAEGFRLIEIVRRRVNFLRGNLLDSNWNVARSYDIVFCRNLLIYFDRETQSRAVQILERLVRDGGHLFVGASEAAVVQHAHLTPVLGSLAPAFQKRLPPPVPAQRPIARHTSKPVRAALARFPAAPGQGISPRSGKRELFAFRTSETLTRSTTTGGGSPAAAGNSAAPSSAALPSLDEVPRLLAGKKSPEAIALCEEHLRQQGASAAAFFAFALVREAAQEIEQARELYRKALYLDPNHYEASIRLAALNHESGETAAAGVLLNRARRIRERARS